MLTRQYSLHDSSGDDSLAPYFGTHLTSEVSPGMPLVMPLNSAHCSSLYGRMETKKLYGRWEFGYTYLKSSESSSQGCVLQEAYLVLLPVQYGPPLAGGGESHDLLDTLMPPPQVLVQCPQLKHFFWNSPVTVLSDSIPLPWTPTAGYRRQRLPV